MAGAVFGEVQGSLFVAGAACVKVEMIAGARNGVFLKRKCSWRARKVTSVARRVAE